jgi:hypothetical protein
MGMVIGRVLSSLRSSDQCARGRRVPRDTCTVNDAAASAA